MALCDAAARHLNCAGQAYCNPLFHYSLFSFSARDSFLSGSHLESVECPYPAGQLKGERAVGRGGEEREGVYGNPANRADRKSPASTQIACIFR